MRARGIRCGVSGVRLLAAWLLCVLALKGSAQTLLEANVAAFGTNAPSGGGGGDTPWVTGQSLGTLRSPGDFDGTVGCTVTVNSTITVTSIGAWVINGSTQSHHIGFFDSGGSLSGFVILNKSGLSTGFHYVVLGTPLVLTAGTYFFGEEEFNSGDAFYNQDTTLTTTAVATISAASFNSTGFIAPSGAGTAGAHCFVPVSFLYH